MLNLSPFWLCTNSTSSGDLEYALNIAADFGFKNVEISAIEGSCEHIDPMMVSPDYVKSVEKLLDERNLTCAAVSAHCDMTDDALFAKFMKKLEFAGMIGAKYINTRCGNVNKYAKLLEHLDIAIPAAEKYGVTINLEAYGDIIGDAKSSYFAFEKLERNLGYNYDAGNLYRFDAAAGKNDISYADDLDGDLKYLKSIHLKDAALIDGFVTHTPIGDGSVGYDGIFKTLEKKIGTIPAGLEAALGFRVDAKTLKSHKLHPTEKDERACIEKSLDFIAKYCVF